MANVNSALTPLQKHAHARVSFQLPAPDQEGEKKPQNKQQRITKLSSAETHGGRGDEAVD